MYIQTVEKDFFRRREREPSISETFVRLNVLDYKRAEQSDHEEAEFIQIVLCSDKLRVNKTVAVINKNND